MWFVGWKILAETKNDIFSRYEVLLGFGGWVILDQMSCLFGFRGLGRSKDVSGSEKGGLFLCFFLTCMVF